MNIENNNSYLNKLLKSKLTFEECYEKICKFNNAKHRYAYEILINSEIRTRNILNNYQYNKLLDLMLNDEKYIVNYLSNEYCSEDEMKKLIDVLISNNSKKLSEILYNLNNYNNLNNFNCIRYIIERIDDKFENTYSIAYALANILNNNEVDNKVKDELIASALYKYPIIDWLVHYEHIFKSKIDKTNRKQMYDLYKKKLFSRRKGDYRLYNTLKFFEDVIELEQLRIVVNKVYKGKDNNLISKLEVSLKIYNLSEEDRDLLEADIMLLKLVS